MYVVSDTYTTCTHHTPTLSCVTLSHSHIHPLNTHHTPTLSCASCDCLQVGHTHNQLDTTFGLLSQHVYDKICGGTTKCDVLSFTGLETVTCMCSYIVYHVHVQPTYSFFDIGLSRSLGVKTAWNYKHSRRLRFPGTLAQRSSQNCRQRHKARLSNRTHSRDH